MADTAKPGPYPPPPAPWRTRPEPAATWYRVHRFDVRTGHYGPVAFNDTEHGNARFSPLIDLQNNVVIPTIYAAASPRAAIAEILLHDVPTPSTGHLYDWERDRTSQLHVSTIQLATLNLVNMSATGLRAAGLSVADLFGGNAPDYPRTRAWALHIWRTLPQAQGLCWMSVRDNTSKVVVLFGDRVRPPHISDGHSTRHIAHYKHAVLELLDELGCGLVLAP
jgi:hypothetical protein